jgi:hypothetical protein
MANNRDRSLGPFASVFRHGDPARSAPAGDAYQDPVSRTTYLSKNHETGATFTCTAPAGSRHANAVRELCANVQGTSLQEPPPQAYGQPILIPAQTQPSGGSMAVYTAPKIGRAQSIRKVKNPNPTKLQLRPQSAENISSSRNANMTFRRVEDDREIVFHSKSTQGEIYVAAPKGSDEAEAHERMVRAQQQRAQQQIMTTRSGQEVKVVSRRPFWGWGA